ncbi:CapA family protein [Cupriavidus sp. WKF15]|uniref:CapA family protein n=1 Tax=Cupriavidus sp. WKF15 TaxID=3032282 RepID=UPI0023E0CF5E|nr:CapA family protein [Cupriavidus sp. WKF15]WER47469.1 CapA family protein [Cupriavidus sp. WKF15]
MTGRGIDQILPTPGNPRLHESYVRSAIEYVELAERRNGAIARPVSPAYIWGDALTELERHRPDVRIVNLESAVTTRDDAWPGKGIHYRMHPANITCLGAARVDCAVLANNHVLDWGRAGMEETVATLQAAGIAVAGAGHNEHEAAQPAALAGPHGNRVLVFAFAMASAGTPSSWEATSSRPGVALLHDCSAASLARLRERIGAQRRDGDVVVVSIHWGPNWGYEVEPERRRFARALIDEAGVDVVHGHSSHHPIAIELHAGRPILYGCGDFINDYEGIGGYEAYRPNLALMIFVALDFAGGAADLRLVPLKRKQFRLGYAPQADRDWLQQMLCREGSAFGTHAARSGEHELRIWAD